MLAALNGPGEASSRRSAILRQPPAADIRLRDQAVVDTSGNGGGTIRIRSGRFLASNRSFVFADNSGASDASGGIVLTRRP